jgi:hypothetical protein
VTVDLRLVDVTVCTLHWYYRDGHLAMVRELMGHMGPPVLRGFLDRTSGAIMLAEGTHRIRAAHSLGMVPVIRSVPWWRGRRSLERARYAAKDRGLLFERVAWRAA